VELSVQDILAINNLINRYGHIIDERQWSRLGELFTDDVIFDMSDFNGEVLNGLGMLSESWKALDGHPLAHHATNILTEVIDDEVTVLSKGIGMYRDRTGSTVYRDALRKTADGWRIARRIATKRRYDTIPEPS
jgi:3-phenylpropionate/cinnamic acid dioxygenase small subunit